MARLRKVNVPIQTIIYVFDTVGAEGATKDGLGNTDFTKYLTKDGLYVSPGTVAVTVTQIDITNMPGAYVVTFTPNATGYWAWRVKNATYAPRGFENEFDVTTDGPLSAADVLAQVAAGLNTAIPGSPTADSLNERIKTMDDAYTAARALKLDNLDATVSSRLATASLVAGVQAAIDATVMAAIADALLDRASAVDGKTPREALRIIGASTSGESSGDPGTPTFKGLDGTTDRLAAVIDGDGNRTSVTYLP